MLLLFMTGSRRMFCFFGSLAVKGLECSVIYVVFDGVLGEIINLMEIPKFMEIFDSMKFLIIMKILCFMESWTFQRKENSNLNWKITNSLVPSKSALLCELKKNFMTANSHKSRTIKQNFYNSIISHNFQLGSVP